MTGHGLRVVRGNVAISRHVILTNKCVMSLTNQKTAFANVSKGVSSEQC